VKSLSLILFSFCSCAVSAQITYLTVFVDYDSAWQYKNLKIIPIRPKGGGGGFAPMLIDNPDIISLSQAINQGLATISERGSASTENVHWLRINNTSDKSIFINSGEMIAGGRQDRMVTKDTILVPTKRDQYIPVMCVEEGRWSDKEKKFAYNDFANIHLRKVLDVAKNQVLIWNEIDNQLQSGDIKNTTMAYLARKSDKKFMEVDDDYFRFFKQKFKSSDSTIVGFVCVSGNKIIGSDIFAGRNLFYGQLEPLLRGYIDEVIIYGGKGTCPDDKIHDYMDKILTDERSQQEFVNKNGKIFRQQGKVIHITTF
jgi:ARG/rhodanese/phosphatase superfamily protein